MTAPRGEARLLATQADVRAAAERLGRAPRIAFDLESNGLFAYRAVVCAVQLASDDEIAVVDTLATPVTGIGELLASPATGKIVHDVSFDARVLAEAGVRLANVQDTSIAARMLGRTATGLASLLASELGITLDKKMQHHDWTQRPIDRAGLAYLAGDVIHLPALCDRLWAEVEARGISEAVDEETRYRLRQAITSAESAGDDVRPPYVRLKGIDKVDPMELPILKRLADARERKARELDVPPYKVLGPDLLFAIARTRPTTESELAKIPGAASGRRARSLALELLRAVKDGLAEEGRIPEEERLFVHPPRLPQAQQKARRAREQRLTAWRRAQAKAREVDEQVVLPGHCLQDLASLETATELAIASVPGIGAFRLARDGEALLATLRDDAPDAGDASGVHAGGDASS